MVLFFCSMTSSKNLALAASRSKFIFVVLMLPRSNVMKSDPNLQALRYSLFPKGNPVNVVIAAPKGAPYNVVIAAKKLLSELKLPLNSKRIYFTVFKFDGSKTSFADAALYLPKFRFASGMSQ